MIGLVSVAVAGDYTVTPAAVTEVPLMVGAGVRLETPPRIWVDAGVGVLPRSYVQLSNAVITRMFPDDYPESTATLVEESLASSLVLRGRLGWRPSARHGFGFGAGGTVATLGGSATGVELVEGITGVQVPTFGEDRLLVDARATVLLVDVGLDWAIPVWRQLVVRPALGWSFTAWAHTDLEPSTEPRFPPAQVAMDAVEAEGEAYLDTTFTRYVHPPWIPFDGQHVLAREGRGYQHTSSQGV
ncbi:MAG: hypothetical protein H6734_18685, partial [Alphaproteobacteria bacterium]|nr:hypothetical protein [Alphaproteobacteria bacterium]